MTSTARQRPPAQLFGGWELGLLVLMALIYVGGTFFNPDYFATGDALASILRDASRVGVLACGMIFVIVNKDLDLSVGSILGLVAVVFSVAYAPSYFDLGVIPAIAIAAAIGLVIGLLNGWLVTVLMVPAFIATLTMLFIGRGLVLAITAGRTVSYATKAKSDGWFFAIGEPNLLGFNNQIFVFLIVAVLAIFTLGKTRWGYETYAVGGNDQAASYAGISVRRVRMRAYVFSALTASLAALLTVAQNKGIDSTAGVGTELIVIAATIVGGGAIAGGRGRAAGACLGAMFVVLVDVVLRQGIPIARMVKVGNAEIEVKQLAQLPPGAVPAFIGLILVSAVALGPFLTRRRVVARLIARMRGLPLPPVLETMDVAIAQPATRGSVAESRSLGVKGPLAFFHRRDAAAILLAIGLWAVGFHLRPDFWASVSNTFNLALAFTEIAFLAIGLTFVMANGDVDLSVGSVLALSASTSAFLMHEMQAPPLLAGSVALLVGLLAGVVNGTLTVRFRMPAFVATLGMFYMARGVGAWLTAGRQLSGFPDSYTLLGRKLIDLLKSHGLEPPKGWLFDLASSISVQTLIMAVLAILAAIVLGRTVIGQMIYATGGNARAAQYAGIPVDRVRFLSLVFSAFTASLAGIIYVAYLRSFNPAAGSGRELDGIASVIIGGGSIFGGFGTVIGSLAGAVVITLIRGILSLQVLLPDGSSFVMPQHWVNVFIGLILLLAVIGDIWIRQQGILDRWIAALRRRMTSPSHIDPIASGDRSG